jgi:hypothetical protein
MTCNGFKTHLCRGDNVFLMVACIHTVAGKLALLKFVAGLFDRMTSWLSV